MDTLGFEPMAFRMRSGCDTTTPCAPDGLWWPRIKVEPHVARVGPQPLGPHVDPQLSAHTWARVGPRLRAHGPTCGPVWAYRTISESHIDALHSRLPLVAGERLVRYEVNVVMGMARATGLPALLGVSPWTRRKGLVSAQEKTANKQQQKKLSMFVGDSPGAPKKC